MDEIIKHITQIPSGVIVYFLFINLIAFCAFALDKLKAMTNRWRIPEKTLFGISLIGGSFGGLAAMQLCRHKTQKPVFKYGLPLMALVQILLFLFLQV